MIKSKNLTIILILILIVQLVLYCWQQTNTARIEYNRNLPESLIRPLDGLRLVHISDLHTNRIGYLEKSLVENLEQLSPDLIIISGDFLNSNFDLPACSLLVNRIGSISPTIATLGNNDHSFESDTIDTERLIRVLKRAGMIVPVNQTVILKHKGDSFYICGLDDNFLEYDNYLAASFGIRPKVPKIVVAHSPSIAGKIDLRGVQLILCGHTHAGQINLPIVDRLVSYALAVDKYYDMKGPNILDKTGTMLYVNRGIGTSVLPLRLGAVPEIAVFDYDPVSGSADNKNMK